MPAAFSGRRQIKRAFVPVRDKSSNTSAVPPKLTAGSNSRPLVLRTTMRTLLITDKVPVSVYSPEPSFKLPLQVHSEVPVLPHLHHRRLSEYTRKILLLLRIGLTDLYSIICWKIKLSMLFQIFCRYGKYCAYCCLALGRRTFAAIFSLSATTT